ncbi:MAG: PRC-barrel domain containing protein [Chitinivibrionales bacterium]|nr:PRC-barrel domain containing protein [Chitinivibrionales bacterium]
MLRSAKEMKGYSIKARDGHIGKVSDFMFDDTSWTIRYLVADVGDWLVHNHVLIAPAALRTPGEREFPVDLTTEQVKNSPNIDTEKPVSRKEEEKLRLYYGWPVYWGPTGFAGPMPAAIPAPEIPGNSAEEQTELKKDTEGSGEDSHLRSLNELVGYNIEASDTGIGHIDDCIIGSETWGIRYLIVDTGNWIPGRKVLVSPAWAESISWYEKVVTITHSSEEVRKSPEYNPADPVNREYEEILYDYYGRPKYWHQ